MYKLVKFKKDYADEFNVCGISLYTEEDLDKTLTYLKDNFDKLNDKEYYFGTNECLEFSNYDEITQSIVISDISEETYKELKNILSDDFGTFSLRCLHEYTEEVLADQKQCQSS